MLNNVWSFILAWYNLPFSVLLGLCAVMAVLQVVGLGGESDHDADSDADVDGDADASPDHDADLNHDADASGDHNGGSESASVEPGLLSLLAFIGMGKAPLAVVLLILFGASGILGWILNSLVQSIFIVYPGLAFAGVLPLSLIGGSVISSRITRLIGQALPPISTTATRAQALVGRRGTVISPFVDAKYGLVHLRDQGGTLISVFVVNPSEQQIKRGNEVVLVSYNEVRRNYTVSLTYPNK